MDAFKFRSRKTRKSALDYDEDSVMWYFRNTSDWLACRNWQYPFGCSVNLVVAISMIGVQVGWTQQSPSKKTAGVRVDDQGRKFINNIPYDVFFDDPLEIASRRGEKTESAAPSGSAETKSKSSSAVEPLPGDGQPTGTKFDWQHLISIEELQSEVKSVRNRLTRAMSNQGSYNSNFKEISIDGSEIAALAAIVQEHSASLTWKDKANYVRDFGAQIGQAAIGLGKENFEKARSAFQKLTSVLDGSIPADAGDVPLSRPFNETASRKSLMRRIERARDFLKQDVNTAAKFKALSEQVQRESALISALGSVVTTSGYEYTSEDEYQQHARSLIDGGTDALSASRDDAYDRFKAAVDKVNKSCTDCHGSYGSG